MKVKDLYGGDVISTSIQGVSAVFIGASKHPVYPDMALVVWRFNSGKFSYDALDWEQDVGFLSTVYRNDNMRVLQEALEA